MKIVRKVISGTAVLTLALFGLAVAPKEASASVSRVWVLSSSDEDIIKATGTNGNGKRMTLKKGTTSNREVDSIFKPSHCALSIDKYWPGTWRYYGETSKPKWINRDGWGIDFDVELVC